jgi:RHS repeat-associated protein
LKEIVIEFYVPASPSLSKSTKNIALPLVRVPASPSLRYDQPFTGISGLTAAPAQKAGNISQIASRVRGREAQIMSYSYDYLSRLSSSTFHNYSDAGVISGTNNYNENLTYDLRGNIQTLQRTGFYTNGSSCTYGQIDNLTYSYTTNTNRLHKVLDGTLTAGDAKSRGFNGLLSTVDNSMTYDRNGNLNKNLHKNVSTITYNHLNLPTVITFTTGNTIEFLYDAAGTKLRKTVKVGATVQYIQDYLPGGIEYRQTGTGVKRVESVFHAEGRYYNTNVDVSSTLAWRKEYNMKDHLGNTRLVFTDRNANGIVDITGTASTSDVLQENHYYAFGLAFEGAWLQNDATARDNAYQYNGIELVEDFSLNLSIANHRSYDPVVGRWCQVDPLSDFAPEWNSYRFGFDNPTIFNDPSGLFETRREAKRYRQENDLDGKIIKNKDGSYSIDNKSVGSTTYRDASSGEVATVALVSAKKSFPRDMLSSGRINGWEQVQKSGLIGFIFYDTVDDAWVTLQQFNPLDTDVRHLDKSTILGSENGDAFAATAAGLIPGGKGMKSVESITVFSKSALFAKINAIQFSKIFKGTIIASLNPQLRGKINRLINKSIETLNKNFDSYLFEAPDNIRDLNEFDNQNK